MTPHLPDHPSTPDAPAAGRSVTRGSRSRRLAPALLATVVLAFAPVDAAVATGDCTPHGSHRAAGRSCPRSAPGHGLHLGRRHKDKIKPTPRPQRQRPRCDCRGGHDDVTCTTVTAPPDFTG